MAEPFRRTPDGDGPPEAASPARRRFERWMARLWGLVALLPPDWDGIIQIEIRRGEVHKVRAFDAHDDRAA